MAGLAGRRGRLLRRRPTALLSMGRKSVLSECAKNLKFPAIILAVRTRPSRPAAKMSASRSRQNRRRRAADRTVGGGLQRLSKIYLLNCSALVVTITIASKPLGDGVGL